MKNLEEGKYYLLSNRSGGSICEVKVERVTETAFLLKFYYRNNFEHPYNYEWILKVSIGDYGRYSILEELDSKYYIIEEREKKLKRIVEE